MCSTVAAAKMVATTTLADVYPCGRNNYALVKDTESHHPSQTESTEKIVDFWSAESLKTVMKSKSVHNVSISNLLKYGG